MAALGSATWDTLVPDLTDVADIQKALRLYHYGDTSLTEVAGKGIWGHLTSLKLNPVFLGTVTLPTGTALTAPIKFVAGTNLTTPVAGSMEFSGTALSFSPSNGVRKTIAFLDSTVDAARSVVHYNSGNTTDYSAINPTRRLYLGQQPPVTASVGDIWMW